MDLSVTKLFLRCKTGLKGLSPYPGLAVQLVPEGTIAATAGHPTPGGGRIIGRCHPGHIWRTRRSGVYGDRKTAGCRPIARIIPFLKVQDVGTFTETGGRCVIYTSRLSPRPALTVKLVPERCVPAAAGCPGPRGCRVADRGRSADRRSARRHRVDCHRKTAGR